MASGNTRAEALVRRAAIEHAMGLVAVNELLDYLSVKLSPNDYAR